MMLFVKLNYKFREYTQVYSFKTKKKEQNFAKLLKKAKNLGQPSVIKEQKNYQKNTFQMQGLLLLIQNNILINIEQYGQNVKMVREDVTFDLLIDNVSILL